MENVYIARQKIFDAKGKLFAYELLFRDHAHGIKDFPSNIKATSHVIMNTLTNVCTNDLLGKNGIGFINVDEEILTSDILDILDKDRFVLEILETTDLSEKVIARIKQYHARGFRICIDDFDCSAEMIIKFNPLFKYVQAIKIDVIASEPENLINVVNKFKKTSIKILAEKVETRREYNEYLDMGFDYFQGYFLSRPESIKINRYKESTQIVILQLIRIIKEDAPTKSIESYIKLQTDLSYKLFKFLNNINQIKMEVESITQLITLLGRDKLLRWLMVYLYSEISTNPASKTILDMAIRRAEHMEDAAAKEDKDKAYLAGMFSMLEAIFEADIKELMVHISIDKDINQLVIEKKGKFAKSFLKIESSEREYLRELFMNNFEKICTVDLIYALEYNGINIDKEKL